MSDQMLKETVHATESPSRVLVKVIAFSLALALVFTLVANTLPQIEGEAPVDEEIELGALTVETFVALGESIFTGKGTCTLCHNNLGRAPDLLALNVVETANTRLKDPGYKAAATDVESYLRESLLEPSAYVVKGFGKKGSNDTESPMPSADKPPIQLSPAEIEAVIAFMQAKDGNEVTVSLPEETPAAAESAESQATSAAAPAQTSAKTPEEIIRKYGCAACHTIMGTESPVGPSLTGIGAKLSADQIRRGIVAPGAEIAEGFPAGIMPGNFADRMTARELEVLVQWLVEQK
jgi:mono/diheme cytochrome c family protein